MTCLLTAALTLILTAQAVSLPDTPHGRAVAEFIEAFNKSEADGLRALHKYGTDTLINRLTPEERRESRQRIQEAFGGLKPTSVISSSATELVLAMKALDGRNAQLVFAFEPGDQVRFSDLRINVLAQ